MELHIVIPYFPPPLNRAYVSIQGRKVLSSESRRFKADSIGYLSTKYLEEISKFRQECFEQVKEEERAFALTIGLYTNWLSSKGKPLRRDVSNYIKLIEDVLAEVLQIDDKYNTQVAIRKIHSPENSFIEIYYSPSRWLRKEEGHGGYGIFDGSGEE